MLLCVAPYPAARTGRLSDAFGWLEVAEAGALRLRLRCEDSGAGGRQAAAVLAHQCILMRVVNFSVSSFAYRFYFTAPVCTT